MVTFGVIALALLPVAGLLLATGIVVYTAAACAEFLRAFSHSGT